jgi:Rrf2 family iron-sulfur cluster assembly transcriptional regulator
MLSKKSINAINAVVWLGFLQSTGPVSLQKISDSLNLSISCLEQIFAGLKAAQLIQSFKGPGGGYFLLRRLEDMTLWDIARIFEHHPVQAPSEPSANENSHAICQEALFSQFQRVSESLLEEMTVQEAVNLCMSGETPPFAMPSESFNRFKLKPLAAAKRPNGPNSVFNWASSSF